MLLEGPGKGCAWRSYPSQIEDFGAQGAPAKVKVPDRMEVFAGQRTAQEMSSPGPESQTIDAVGA